MGRLYHVWFSTKGRKEALEGELGENAKQLLVETTRRTGIRLLGLETVAGHVHLLVEVTQGQTLSSVMHQLKGATARFLFLKYPELKLDIGHNSFWQKGYGWRAVAQNEVPAIRRYIRTQRDRPLRRGY